MEPKVFKDVQSKIVEITDVAHNAKAFRFLMPTDFDYYPGQFIMLRVDMRETEEFKIKEGKNPSQVRAFSISSSPTSKGFVEVAIKEEEHGFVSVYMNKVAQVGDDVKISGPFGKFYFTEGMADEIILLAAGSGVAPFMGILRYITAKNLPVKTTLIYSNRTPQDIIYKKELDELANLPNIKIVHTITRAKDEHKWAGQTGRIDEALIKKYTSDLTKPLFYICGPPEFSNNMESLFSMLGIPKEKIHTEKW